jgi:hypothetical protein
VTQEAPGIERVNALEIPRLVTTQKKMQEVSAKPSYLPFLRYAVAAAAIFLIGFFLGTQWPMSFRAGAPEISEKPLVEIEKRTGLPSPSPIQPGETVKSRLAELGARRSVTRQNGRLFIETTLKDSDTRAFWVVDAGFRLAQSSTQ